MSFSPHNPAVSAMAARFAGEDRLPPPGTLARSLFNGLARIIVQSTRKAGEIKLTARANGLVSDVVTMNTQPGSPRPQL